MPYELRTLRYTRRAQRVAFGDEAAGRVDDAAAAVGDVAISDHFVGFAWFGEAQCVEGDHLVRGEAIVQFADCDVLRGDVRFGHSGSSGVLRHSITYEVDGRAVEEGGVVGGEVLTCDEDGLGAKVRAGGEEGF